MTRRNSTIDPAFGGCRIHTTDPAFGGCRIRYHTIAARAIALGIFACAATSTGFVGCYSHGETTCGQESSRRARIRGRLTVRAADKSVRAGADALVFVELCGLYSDNPDPSKGNPNYRYVGRADKDGNFEISIPKGTVGLHAF